MAISYLDRAPVLRTILSNSFRTLTTMDMPIKQLEEWETLLDQVELPLQAPNHEYLWEAKELQERVQTP